MDAGSAARDVAFDPPSHDCGADTVVGDVSANVYDATSDSKRTRWAASLHPTPYALSSRSSACDMILTRIVARSARDDAVEDSKQGCGRGPSSENDTGLGDAALYALVELTFAGGRDSSVVLGGEPACDAPTVGLCERLKAQVAQVYKDRASDICRSPERPDLRLSKEEAQGHAMGSLVIGELLESEARRVGKDIDNVCAKEAAMVKQASKDSKEARRKARQAAADSETAAEAVAAVDAAVELARAERLRASVVLPNLPPRRTIIVPAPAPRSNRCKPSAIIRTPEDHLARLQEQAAVMEAAVPLAQAAHSKAKRARERAQDECEAALKRVRALSVLASDETFNELQSEFKQSGARVSELMRAEYQAEEAVDLARGAAEEARDDVCEQERAVAHECEATARAAADAERVREEQEEERVHKMAHLEEVLDILCGTGPPPCVCRPHPCDPPYRPVWWTPCGPRCERYRSQHA